MYKMSCRSVFIEALFAIAKQRPGHAVNMQVMDGQVVGFTL